MTSSPTDRRAGQPGSQDFAFFPQLGPAEAHIVGLYRQLESSQWWPEEKLRQWQWAQLARLVAHARQHVPFYAGRLDGLLLGAQGGIDESAWRSLPILTKQEVRAEAARIKSGGLPPSVPVYSEWTSGASGLPLEVVKTAVSDLLFRAHKLRMLCWHGYDPMGKVCEFRPFAKTAGAVHRIPCWERPFGSLFQTGPQVLMDIFSTIEAQVQLLEAEAPHYLTIFPSNLRLLLRALRQTGKRLPSLRLVRTMSERLDPDLRRECQEILGVPLVDCYGSQEAGYIAIQCPEHAHYHVQSEMNLVEVLRDEDGAPCQPGETGHVVVTPLHAFAMPLLRYELGDYAEVGEPCPCGRGLPVLRQIYGRKKEALTLPSGERRYSIFASEVFETLRAVIQYQVVQKSLTELEVRIVAERPLEKAECDQIIDGLAMQVGPGFEIRLIFVESIPRLPGGKYMDFFSEIESANP